MSCRLDPSKRFGVAAFSRTAWKWLPERLLAYRYWTLEKLNGRYALIERESRYSLVHLNLCKTPYWRGFEPISGLQTGASKSELGHYRLYRQASYRE